MDDAVAQFCAVTASDTQQAEQYLSVADGDLENAIALFFESGGASIESQQRAGNSGNNGSGSIESDDDISEADTGLAERLQQEEYQRGGGDNVRERIQPVTERLVQPDYYPSMMRNSGSSRFSSTHVSGNLPVGIFNQRITSRRTLGSDNEGNEDGDEEDEEEDLRRSTGSSSLTAHQSRLARLFRPPFDIMHDVDLESAKEEAASEQKWIMVNIQDPKEFVCQQLNRDLWSNRAVKETLKENFYFVQYASDLAAGLEYSQYYPFTKYPHISILDPRTGEQLKVWNEKPTVSGFVEQVHEFLSRYSLDPGHKNPIGKVTKVKKTFDQMTEEEQIQAALKQSLGVNIEEDSDLDDDDDEFVSIPDEDDYMDSDDDDIQVVQVNENKQASKQEAEGESSKTGSRKDEDMEEDLTEEDKFASILPESFEEPPADPKTTTRIQIRLSDGSRVVRRFSLDDDISRLYAFAKANIDQVSGHYFNLTDASRHNLIDSLGKSVSEAGLSNSVVLLEILD